MHFVGAHIVPVALVCIDDPILLVATDLPFELLSFLLVTDWRGARFFTVGF